MLLRARTVLPITAPPIDDGAVLIGDGCIVAVGRWADLRPEASGQIIDLGDAILLPGLINAHCHLDYTDMAGQLPPTRVFTDWIKQIITLKSGWTRDDYVRSWTNGAAMLLRSGTTTVMDIETMLDLLPGVWASTPLRVISCAELISVRSHLAVSDQVTEAVARLSALNDPMKRVGLAPHAPYSTTLELLSLAARAAMDRSWPLTLHVAESQAEFEMFMYRRGSMFDWLKPQRGMDDCGLGSPVHHVGASGLLGRNCVAAHVNYLWDNDAEMLARSGSSVVHCPRSHDFFQHQRFPFDRLQTAGVNICLGTDSLATLVTKRGEAAALNLFLEMRAFLAMAPLVAPEAIVRMATVNGARALGLAGRVGELCVGASADLIALPHSSGAGDPWEAVVSHQGDVQASMIAGQWVLNPPLTGG
ncbi:MAG: amidohydrolase family protein [Opitutaceae bacterium]|nr:amidohydrolase family protein [Verrucomicrobiales bacterium]